MFLLPSDITTVVQEQPLLLEELLEQEKREQEKQQSTATGPAAVETSGGEMMSAPSLLSDTEFERLRAEVLATGTQKTNVVASPPHPLLSGNTQAIQLLIYIILQLRYLSQISFFLFCLTY